eukprot:15439819-Alexandrium_andersonii.AAC.1
MVPCNGVFHSSEIISHLCELQPRASACQRKHVPVCTCAMTPAMSHPRASTWTCIRPWGNA